MNVSFKYLIVLKVLIILKVLNTKIENERHVDGEAPPTHHPLAPPDHLRPELNLILDSYFPASFTI